MDKFTTLRAVAAPFYHADVDTDELIPHRFLRKPLSAGYGNFLFHDKRRGTDRHIVQVHQRLLLQTGCVDVFSVFLPGTEVC